VSEHPTGEKTVVMVGTLDTKGDEYAYLRDRLHMHGVRTVLVDVGTLDPPRTEPDIDRRAVAAAGGVDLDEITRARDRGRAVSAMARAAASTRKGAATGSLPPAARATRRSRRTRCRRCR
jgi:uncharacterized protein (UPF0261 family)